MTVNDVREAAWTVGRKLRAEHPRGVSKTNHLIRCIRVIEESRLADMRGDSVVRPEWLDALERAVLFADANLS